MFLVLQTFENMANYRKHCFRNKNVSEVLGKHFVSATMFPDLGKQGNIDRKYDL